MSLSFALVFTFVCLAYAQQPINLTSIWGTCQTYSVHAANSIAYSGLISLITSGDIGVSPGTSITGTFTISPGTQQPASVGTCAIDKAAAYNTISGVTCDFNAGATDLGGVTLTVPGTYCYSGALTVSASNTLTLNSGGNGDGQYIFRAPSISTQEGSRIVIINGQQARNVFFVSTSSASIGPNSLWLGQLNTVGDINVASGASFNGRAFSQAAVTFAASTTTFLPTQTTVAPTSLNTFAPSGAPTAPVSLPPTGTPTSAPTRSPSDINAAVAAILSPPTLFDGLGFSVSSVNFTVQPTSGAGGRIQFAVSCPAACDQTAICTSIRTRLYALAVTHLAPPPCNGRCLGCAFENIVGRKRSEDQTATAVVVIPAGYNSSSGLFASLALLVFATFFAL